MYYKLLVNQTGINQKGTLFILICTAKANHVKTIKYDWNTEMGLLKQMKARELCQQWMDELNK